MTPCHSIAPILCFCRGSWKPMPQLLMTSSCMQWEVSYHHPKRKADLFLVLLKTECRRLLIYADQFWPFFNTEQSPFDDSAS